MEVDSGAITHVCNKSTGKGYGIRETEFSKKGGYYNAANGTKIMNEGEKTINGVNDSGAPASMTFQVGKVNGPLGSVRKMCQSGNRVVFDEEASYIEHKPTGEITPIHNIQERYILKLWARNSKDGKVNQVNTGQFDALKEEEETECQLCNSDESGFTRLGEDWI